MRRGRRQWSVQKLRLVFAGTPSAAVPSLERLAAGPHEVVAAITRPAAPLGRKRVLTPSPVAIAAVEHGIPVIEAARLGDDATGCVAALEPDLGVIVAYGGLVREPLLSTPRHGWINLHFSLLPAWRGAAPVQHALIAGDARTGASVFRLVPELDAGDVYGMRSHRDRPGCHGGDAARRARRRRRRPARRGGRRDRRRHGDRDAAGGRADVRAEARHRRRAPRLDGARRRGPRSLPRRDARARRLDDPRRPAAQGARRRRGPGCRAPLPPGGLELAGRRLLVGTGTVPLELRRVQPAGRTAMAAADWWRGAGREGAVAR